MSYKLSDFDFDLPEELIAQYPLEKREDSRLLVVDRNTKKYFITEFKHIKDYLPKKSFLVLNNTKVIKSRLLTRKDTGGKVELFFLEQIEKNRFKALTKGNLKKGDLLKFDNHIGVKIHSEDGDGIKIVEVLGTDPLELLERYGHIPLPPYIKRNDEQLDEHRYQTVYASKPGSVAAPTAGLHFSEELLQSIGKDHPLIEITLNVGIGTFKPIKTENINDHKMHQERYYIPKSSFDQINDLKLKGYTLIAVGTTSLRSLESSSEDGLLTRYGEQVTDIFIKPGYQFKIVDHLITNFHLPKSTLFMLVCAFAGIDYMKEVYNYAIKNRLRFFSYGDAMLIL
ncbi:MAG: tRNA preQ1(34) S-adenosylmethionine ribosyltransferase-isomerase QueA [Calditerrivibrio sp.]|nr:tRNA preQ1(34) S-adenosylmethionine ribosyltransferase-isomerase QueA [Calditerrivibrio sp.]